MCLYYKFPSGTPSKSLFNGIQPILLEHCDTQQRDMFVASYKRNIKLEIRFVKLCTGLVASGIQICIRL